MNQNDLKEELLFKDKTIEYLEKELKKEKDTKWRLISAIISIIVSVITVIIARKIGLFK